MKFFSKNEDYEITDNNDESADANESDSDDQTIINATTDEECDEGD